LTGWFRPLLRFGALALVPVALLGGVLAHELNSDVQQRYLDSTKSSGVLITQVGIQPLITSAQLTSGLSADEVAEIDARLHGAAAGEQVRRLKVWNRAGMIVYSDNHALIGRTFTIDDDLGSALAGKSSASITNGHDEEKTGDDLAGPLVQVYIPLTFTGTASPSGAFELYLPYAPVQAAIDSESRQLYALLAAGLALFYLSMFPIVVLALRWQRQAQAAAIANVTALERLNELKAAFLAGISHQFRTALVGIYGFTELIRDSERLDAEELRPLADDVHRDVERLARAFDKMLELDRSANGGGVDPPTARELERVVNDVVQATHSGAEPMTVPD